MGHYSAPRATPRAPRPPSWQAADTASVTDTDTDTDDLEVRSITGGQPPYPGRRYSGDGYSDGGLTDGDDEKWTVV